MSDIGEPELPEESADDLDEQTSFLVYLVKAGAGSQEGPESPRVRASPGPRDAPDLIRALRAAGASPRE
eukprot:15456234-Alexandrium_andersonii.AAC.1